MFKCRTWVRRRVRKVREPLIRLGGFCYLAAQCFGSTPSVLQTATVAQMHRLAFLARYSNTSTLVTTSLALMVSTLCYRSDSCLGAYRRWVPIRQGALRTFAAMYMGANSFYLFPRYVRTAYSPQWTWVLRYSGSWPLLMTAVGLMVSVA